MEIVGINGHTISLQKLKGKVVFVNFWATWCAPCLQEMPGFSRMQRRLTEKGVQFVGIGIDNPDKIRDFSNYAALSYPLLIGAADTLSMARKLGNHSEGLPYTVVIDPKGALRATRLGAWSEEELEKFLAEIPR